MEIVAFFFIAVALLTGFTPLGETPENEIQIAYPDFSARAYEAVTPASKFLREGMVRQNYDYSCGSAALATVLNYQLGENFSEKQVIAGLLKYGDPEAIKTRRAFSLLDMKRFVDELGYNGMGYKATVDDLKELGRPCIIPITVSNYRHFVVFKGINRGHIFFADPFWGNTSYTLQEFESNWFRNAIFVVYPEEGVPELQALRLKEEDLRYIDEEAARDIMFTHDDNWPLAREWEMEKTLRNDTSVRSRGFDAFQSIEAP